MYLNLKLQLWKTGLHQNRLARMLDLDDATLSKIVNGFRKPSAQVRKRIAAMLHSNEKWLFRPASGHRGRSGPKKTKTQAGS